MCVVVGPCRALHGARGGGSSPGGRSDGPEGLQVSVVRASPAGSWGRVDVHDTTPARGGEGGGGGRGWGIIREN